MPDDNQNNVLDNITTKYFFPWMISVDHHIVVDHRLGKVYSRNEYVNRYRRGGPMLPPPPRWERELQPHPASPEIRTVLQSGSAMAVKFHNIFRQMVWLGITEDRAAVWYADFTEDQRYAQVCMENLKNDAWHCVVVATSKVPATLQDDLERKDVVHHPHDGAEPFVVPDHSISYGIVRHSSTAGSESRIRDWLSTSVRPLKEGDIWKLDVAAGTKVLDSTFVRQSNLPDFQLAPATPNPDWIDCSVVCETQK